MPSLSRCRADARAPPRRRWHDNAPSATLLISKWSLEKHLRAPSAALETVNHAIFLNFDVEADIILDCVMAPVTLFRTFLEFMSVLRASMMRLGTT